MLSEAKHLCLSPLVVRSIRFEILGFAQNDIMR
jgi:hypothetical protein